MSDIIEIPKANAAHDNFPCWIDTYLPDGKRTRPDIICNCGEQTHIGNHHVHPDGRITASYFHHRVHGDGETDGCGWHVYLKMIGWDGGEFKPHEV